MQKKIGKKMKWDAFSLATSEWCFGGGRVLAKEEKEEG